MVWFWGMFLPLDDSHHSHTSYIFRKCKFQTVRTSLERACAEEPIKINTSRCRHFSFDTQLFQFSAFDVIKWTKNYIRQCTIIGSNPFHWCYNSIKLHIDLQWTMYHLFMALSTSLYDMCLCVWGWVNDMQCNIMD